MRQRWTGGGGVAPTGGRGWAACLGVKQGRARTPTCGPRQQYRVAALNLIRNQFKRIQIQFKLLQTLTDPKRTFPNSKFLKQNMVVDVLKKGTIFSIGTPPDSECISNENSENFLSLEFNRISFVSIII
jgi:hypothetical protein